MVKLEVIKVKLNQAHFTDEETEVQKRSSLHYLHVGSSINLSQSNLLSQLCIPNSRVDSVKVLLESSGGNLVMTEVQASLGWKSPHTTFTNCVTLGKLLVLLVPQFPLENGD